MRSPQKRHLPPRSSQLKTGTRSRAPSVCPQEAQWLLPLSTLSPCVIRHARQFRKLPMKSPNTNARASVLRTAGCGSCARSATMRAYDFVVELGDTMPMPSARPVAALVEDELPEPLPESGSVPFS